MNKYVKVFLKRGFAFAGLGPIIAGVVDLSIFYTIDNFTLTGLQVFVAILSTYVLAFLQAGASVFNQIEEWSLLKSTFFHFITIYVAYVGCYLINSWIPFDIMFIIVFTACFLAMYLIIWIIVYLCIKATSKKLNSRLKSI